MRSHKLYSTVQYSTVQYSTVQYRTVEQMLPLSSHRFYIMQSNHLNDSFILLPTFRLLLASVKLCLGSRVAVLGANGAGEQQPLNPFLFSYLLPLLLLYHILFFAIAAACRGYSTTLVIWTLCCLLSNVTSFKFLTSVCVRIYM